MREARDWLRSTAPRWKGRWTARDAGDEVSMLQCWPDRRGLQVVVDKLQVTVTVGSTEGSRSSCRTTILGLPLEFDW